VATFLKAERYAEDHANHCRPAAGGIGFTRDTKSERNTDMINILKLDFSDCAIRERPRRKAMKTIFLAAAAALTLGSGSAFARDNPSASGYVYPDFWAPQAAQPAPTGNSVIQSNRDAIGTYTTHTDHNGTWLFPPDPWGGGGG
jgi:hypothetical protein